MQRTHRDTVSQLDPLMVLVTVTVLTVVVKLALSLPVNHSGHLAEDYDYLLKARHYLNLDFAAKTHPFGGEAAGILYSLVVAPWMLFSGNAVQFKVVIAINSLLSVGTIWFATLAVWDTSRAKSLAVPVVLAVLPPVFLFNFYALTENLMLFLSAAAAWMSTRLPRTDSSGWMDVFFIAVIVVSPLARPPGFAVLLAVVAVVLALWPQMSTTRRWLYLLGAPLLTLLFYGLVQFTPLEHRPGEAGSREEFYILSLRQIFSVEGSFTTLTKLFLSQIAYLGIATLFLPFAYAIWGVIKFVRAPKSEAPEFAALTVFCAVAGAIFVGFCLAHLIPKLNLDPNLATFIYGRYNDPAVLLVMIIGLAVMTAREEPPHRLVLGIAAILVIIACVRFFSASAFTWGTVNQTGLQLFWQYRLPAFATVFSIAILLLFLPRRIAYAGYVLLALAVFVVTDIIGYQNALHRSRRIALDVAAADWIEDHVPATDCVGFDGRHLGEKAVGMKSVERNFRAVAFLIYPRKVEIERRPDKRPGSCAYFLTIRRAVVPPAWKEVWADDHYAVYSRPVSES